MNSEQCLGQCFKITSHGGNKRLKSASCNCTLKQCPCCNQGEFVQCILDCYNGRCSECDMHDCPSNRCNRKNRKLCQYCYKPFISTGGKITEFNNILYHKSCFIGELNNSIVFLDYDEVFGELSDIEDDKYDYFYNLN
jgi:hypothetical protein